VVAAAVNRTDTVRQLELEAYRTVGSTDTVAAVEAKNNWTGDSCKTAAAAEVAAAAAQASDLAGRDTMTY